MRRRSVIDALLWQQHQHLGAMCFPHNIPSVSQSHLEFLLNFAHMSLHHPSSLGANWLHSMAEGASKSLKFLPTNCEQL